MKTVDLEWMGCLLLTLDVLQARSGQSAPAGAGGAPPPPGSKPVCVRSVSPRVAQKRESFEEEMLAIYFFSGNSELKEKLT